MAITIQAPAFVRTSKKKGFVVPLGLFDILKFEKTAKRQISIIRENGFRFPTNDQCQVHKIATELHRKVPGRIGIRISIQKKIPPRKGLGSWASASAGTLLALNGIWDLDLSEKALIQIASKVNPSVAKILKIHFKSLRSEKPEAKRWAIAVTPKWIEIDRGWVQKTSCRDRLSTATVTENHFPDLRTIQNSLAAAGWKGVGLSRLGPAIVGFSEKRIGIAKIPKTIRSKLDFSWIGKPCDGQFKLLD